MGWPAYRLGKSCCDWASLPSRPDERHGGRTGAPPRADCAPDAGK